MIRYLITGYSGFVCKQFLYYLEKQEELISVLALIRHDGLEMGGSRSNPVSLPHFNALALIN